MAFGRRVTVSSGTADIRNILQREAAGESLDGVHKDIEMLQEDTTRIERGKMFVMGIASPVLTGNGANLF